jgi:hypothetical protein
MNIIEDACIFGGASITAYPLLLADNRSVRHDLPAHQTLQFGKETRACEFFAQHSPILYMGLYETVSINITLNNTFMPVNV